MDAHNLKDEDGNTPLHLFCQNPRKVQARLNAWARKGTTPDEDKTVIIQICGKWGPTATQEDILKIMAEHGVPFHEKNREELTPLDLMIQYYERKSSKKDSKYLSSIVSTLHHIIDLGGKPNKSFIEHLMKLSIHQFITGAHMQHMFQPNLVEIPMHIPMHTLIRIKLKNDEHRAVRSQVITHLLDELGKKTPPDLDGSLYRTAILVLVKFACTNLKQQDEDLPSTTMNGDLLIHILTSIRKDGHKIPHTILNEIMSQISQHLLKDMKNDDILRADHEGNTALHLAILTGLISVVRNIIDHDVTIINAINNDKETALISLLVAMKKKVVLDSESSQSYLDIGRMLLEQDGIDVDKADSSGATALIRLILLIGNAKYYTKRVQYKKICDSSEKEVHVPHGEYCSPLMVCAAHDLHDIAKSILEDKDRVTDVLSGDNKDDKGGTILHIAAKNNSQKCMKLFIDHEPKLCNMQDDEGNTPLFHMVIHCDVTCSMIYLKKYPWDFKLENYIGENVFTFYTTYYDPRRKNLLTDEKQSQALKKELKELAGFDQQKDKRSRHMDPQLKEFGFSKTWAKLRSTVSKSKRMSQRPVKPTSNVDRRVLLTYILQNMRALSSWFDLIIGKTKNVESKHDDKTALMWCAQLGLSEEINGLGKHLDKEQCNQVDSKRRNALQLALVHTQFDCARIILIDIDIDLNHRDKFGKSGVFYIVEQATEYISMQDALSMLNPDQYHWDYEIRDNFGRNAVEHYWAECSRKETKRSQTLEEALRRFCGIPDNSGSSSVSDDARSQATLIDSNMLPVHSYAEIPTLNGQSLYVQQASHIGASDFSYSWQSSREDLIRLQNDQPDSPEFNPRSIEEEFKMNLQMDFANRFINCPAVYDHMISNRLITSDDGRLQEWRRLGDADAGRQLFEYATRLGQTQLASFYLSLKHSESNGPIVGIIKSKIPRLPEIAQDLGRMKAEREAFKSMQARNCEVRNSMPTHQTFSQTSLKKFISMTPNQAREMEQLNTQLGRNSQVYNTYPQRIAPTEHKDTDQPSPSVDHSNTAVKGQDKDHQF